MQRDGLSSVDPAQAQALEAELEWLAQTLERRLQLYFKPTPGDTPPWPDPPSLKPDCPYGQMLLGLQLDAEERLMLALALTPLLRPQLLDVLQVRNDSTHRPYTEFGGAAVGQPQGGFVPSGETA
ncbi:MAG: hypothetical protein Q8M96_01555 [Rubrivivax sp.]|nr:hypothetical protein [Rubrivivax sp.]